MDICHGCTFDCRSNGCPYEDIPDENLFDIALEYARRYPVRTVTGAAVVLAWPLWMWLICVAIVRVAGA